MNIVDVTAALQGHLATITPALATALENQPFTPTAGTPYQAVDNLRLDPDNPTMGDGFYRERGILQVKLCYPAGAGSGAALARAELVRAAFARGTMIAAADGFVLITQTPSVAPALIDGDRFCIPVRVRWQADVFP